MKKRLISIIGVLIIGVSLAVKAGDTQKLNYEVSKQNEDSGVYVWLNAFKDKDYESCDWYASQDGVSLTADTSDFYSLFLDILVGSVEGIEIKDIKDDKSTGYTDYTIQIERLPIKRVSTLKIDDKKISKMLDKYEKGNDSDELESSLNDYYIGVFKDSFQYDTSKEPEVLELHLMEKGSCVYGTETFIKELISDDMRNNLEVFQSESKIKIDTALRSW